MNHRALIFELRDLPGYVNGTGFTDDDLKRIPPGTVVLNLEGSSITHEGILRLPPLSELRCLDLDSTKLADQSLAALSRFPRLEELWLECTCISDLGLKELHACTHLRFVSVAYTAVTEVGVKQLVAAVPSVQVSA